MKQSYIVLSILLLNDIDFIYNFVWHKCSDMSTESSKVNWFEGVSDKVRCNNCHHWTAPSEFSKEMGDTQGECGVIPAHGGAWHMAGTDPDMFCSEFELRANVG